MSGRWEPKCGETYYYVNAVGVVSNYVWHDDSTDDLYYKSGNCFKTKAKAEAAAKKYMDLLLSLHEPSKDCNQLPKLTEEVFNRPDCPEWAKYAAVAAGGNVIYFSNKPYPDDIAGVWHGAEKWAFIEAETGGTLKCNVTDWENSLIKRPKKLPDWCKVGEWIFADPEKLFGPAGYKKIKTTDGLGLTFADGCCIYFLDKIKQARLRPYNAEEMKMLVGQVIENRNYVHFINSFDKELQEVVSGHDGYSAKDLIEFGYTLDGSPCGVLEHFENGEWVK